MFYDPAGRPRYIDLKEIVSYGAPASNYNWDATQVYLPGGSTLIRYALADFSALMARLNP